MAAASGSKKSTRKAARPSKSAVEEVDVPLVPGTEVMRRCAVVEARKSGLPHLRGHVVRVEASRVVVAWDDDGREEALSRRRAQTMADAFFRLPSTHEFRRRRSRQATTTTTTKARKRGTDLGDQDASGGGVVAAAPPREPSARKKRRSEPDEEAPADEQQSPPVEEEEEEEEVRDAGTEEQAGEEAEHQDSGGAAAGASRDGDDPPLHEKDVVGKADATSAVEQLRHRKADPEMKIEWHGGKGFGAAGKSWVNVGAGKFRSRHSIEAAPPKPTS